MWKKERTFPDIYSLCTAFLSSSKYWHTLVSFFYFFSNSLIVKRKDGNKCGHSKMELQLFTEHNLWASIPTGECGRCVWTELQLLNNHPARILWQMLSSHTLLSIQTAVASLLRQTQSKVWTPQIKSRHSVIKPRTSWFSLQLLTLPVFTDLVSSLAIAAAAALFAVRLTSARHAFSTPLSLSSPSTTPAQRARRVALSHQPLTAFSSNCRTPPVASTHLKASEGEQGGAEGEPGSKVGLEVCDAAGGVLLFLLRPRSTSFLLCLLHFFFHVLSFSRLADLCTQAGLLCGSRG